MNHRIFVAVMLSILAQVSGGSETYRGAVVEYHPVGESRDEFTAAENAKNYIKFIKQAKAKAADIIVFPEGGLFTNILSPIPNPSDHIVPCDSLTFETTQFVKDLSCAAKNSAIYTVINLFEKRSCEVDDANCPPKKFYSFNTNVVFDRTGMVIARYAKYNLYSSEPAEQPESPELVFFDTDFNVRFGTFTCFDILFSTPTQKLVRQYGIKNFVFTTFWFSELPFLTALQMQRGWAETNNVNLLASGVNYPSKGSGGSGIYNGKYGHIVQIMPEKETSKLLIADIPKLNNADNSNVGQRKTRAFSEFIQNYSSSAVISADERQIVKDSSQSDLLLFQDQIHLYSSEIISRGKDFEKKVCSSNDFCCDFQISMEVLKPEAVNYTYRAMAFNGVRKFGNNFKGGVQSCGLVLCNGPDIKNCTNRVKNIPGLFKFTSIRIKGNFNLRNSFQMPSTLTDGKELKPLSSNQYEFTEKRKNLNSEVSLELLWPVDNLHTFAIWGRDFTRDMEPDWPISGASALVPFPFVFSTILGFVLFAR